ncbi:hypothetical protein HSIEG1_2105 [Enterococcus sp. HSIEG1]|nr:hypothetical protein HSIEG1_2105 [Enterococcus sp. HSIEG1]OJG51227.1 hypothetical protein RV03_GL000123 [Enterococcus gallinarum]
MFSEKDNESIFNEMKSLSEFPFYKENDFHKIFKLFYLHSLMRGV